MKSTSLLQYLRESRSSRIVAAFLLINLCAELISPTVALALTAGPTQPEFTSFEPIATTDMVNDFTGDFTYNLPVLNVPGPDGGSYAMSLSYHSGSSCEEEASWVGYGWTLNPGAINRGKRGFPDEYCNTPVIKYNKTQPNWTQSARFDMNMELGSADKDNGKKTGGNALSGEKAAFKFNIMGFGDSDDGPPDDIERDNAVSVSRSHTVRYNNYTGFSISTKSGIGFAGMNLSMNDNGVDRTLGFSVNPMAILSKLSTQKMKDGKIENEKKWKTQLNKSMQKLGDLQKSLKNSGAGIQIPTSFSVKTYEAPALNYSVAKQKGVSWNFSGSFEANPAGPIGWQMGTAGDLNIQANVAISNEFAFGYRASAEANGSNNIDKVYDYQIENEGTYSKRDKNLGIPINSADVFMATGNDVVGGFRLQHKSIGTFYPNTTLNINKIRQMSGEVGIGQTFQIGSDFAIGNQKISVAGKWHPPTNQYLNSWNQFSTDVPQMRFNNDPGGEIDYDGYLDTVFTAKIDDANNIDLSMFNLTRNTNKLGNTSDIKYEMKQNGSAIVNDSIKGLTITGKDGDINQYSYPLYTRNEYELNVGLPTNEDGLKMIVTNTLNLANPELNKTVVGQFSAQKYASTFLLTSKVTPNYVDISGNGPSEDDFGGWTKFDYRKIYGGNLDWYRYRNPYNGLSYNINKKQDLNDQTGSMSSGEKEVAYLSCIETKSHIAFFVTNAMTVSTFTTNFPASKYPFLYNSSGVISTVTANLIGSGSTRTDGLDAAGIVAGMDRASTSLTIQGTHALEKLEKIVLFAKTDLSQPINTTYFEYNNSICNGILNSSASGSSQTGKLTLKRVWFESGGAKRSRIAPYQFHYEYFNNYPSLGLSWLTPFNNLPSNDASQNPNYEREMLDCWGNYQIEGLKRQLDQKTWVTQKDQSTSSNFDPAAWQLKRIQLPSGGEIHVQYEQEDYSRVQDQAPMAMVSLESGHTGNAGYKNDDTEYAINLYDLAVPINSSDINAYCGMLKRYFVDDNNKLFFKALYNCRGEDTPQLSGAHQNYSYVSGYTTVNEVVVNGSQIIFKLGDKNKKTVNSNLLSNFSVLDRKVDKSLPRFLCYEELLTNGSKNLGPNTKDYTDTDYTDAYYGTNDSLRRLAFLNVFKNTINLFTDWTQLKIRKPFRREVCKTLNTELSYFKIPVYHAKKGGGIRVRRLMMYDPGLESDAALYGTEYIYQNEDGTSSGVATNEPISNRVENALVEYLARFKQKTFNKLLRGRDTKITEGPLGESLLPNAEVCYSRIVTRNIRQGKSTDGFAVVKYHTTKNHPFKVAYSDISKKNGTYKKKRKSMPLGTFSNDINWAWITQGFLFTLNDMNGKLESKTVYPGTYDPSSYRASRATAGSFYNTGYRTPVALAYYSGISATDLAKETGFTTKTTFNYSRPGVPIKTSLYNKLTKNIQTGILKAGTEEDYTLFTSSVHEKTNDFSIELDINISIAAPVIYITFAPGFNVQDYMLSQHITSKVISKKSFLLSTTSVADGVTQTTENLAFDRLTGDPILTRTFDGYGTPQEQIKTEKSGLQKHDSYYYSLNIPAAWVYGSLGPISSSSNNTNQLGLSAASIVNYGPNAFYDALKASNSSTWNPTTSPLQKVINGSVITYSNNWFSSTDVADFPGLQGTALTKANNFYYPLKSYTFKENTVDANTSTGKIYDAGYSSSTFSFPDWSNMSSQWYSPSTITRYSPYGYPIQEEDALGISNTVKFGYSNALPIAVAQNAKFNEIHFQSFEFGVSPNPNVTASSAHSGKYSYNLSDQTFKFADQYPVTNAILNRGLSIRVWLKSSLSTIPTSADFQIKNTNPQFKANIGGMKFPFTALAQTGEWTLYAAHIQNFNSLSVGTYDIKLEYTIQGNETVLVDDFKIQPADASMNCSVYFSDNRLAAQFDDQHFATFYEYNGMGQLVRKSIETERGRKTLQEQQYNTPLILK